MRKDMFKVIVGRPRVGGRGEHKGRRAGNRSPESLPSRESMKAAARRHGDLKVLNENLNPLRRYLEKQVGRPWAKVYSEICEHLNADSTVQQHVRDHIPDFVADATREHEGEVYIMDPMAKWPGGPVPLAQSSIPLWVDPSTGLLRENKDYRVRQRKRNESRREQELSVAKRRRDVSDTLQYHRLAGGAWWLVELGPARTFSSQLSRDDPGFSIPEPDVVLEAGLSALPPAELYGRGGVQAVRKRQMSKREVKRLGLPNDPLPEDDPTHTMPDDGPSFF